MFDEKEANDLMNSLIHSGKLTQQQAMDIRESFQLFDKNGDGVVSSEEIRQVMQSLGLHADRCDVDAMIRQVDQDGNGEIDFKEFVMMMAERFSSSEGSNSQECNFRRVFSVFDPENKGYIDSTELKRVMLSLGEDLTDTEINAMIQEADSDGNGRVEFEEFVKILSGKK